MSANEGEGRYYAREGAVYLRATGSAFFVGKYPLEADRLAAHLNDLESRLAEAEARYQGFREGARIGAEWSRKEVAFWKQRAEEAEARAQRAEEELKAYHQDFYQTITAWLEEALAARLAKQGEEHTDDAG